MSFSKLVKSKRRRAQKTNIQQEEESGIQTVESTPTVAPTDFSDESPKKIQKLDDDTPTCGSVGTSPAVSGAVDGPDDPFSFDSSVGESGPIVPSQSISSVHTHLNSFDLSARLESQKRRREEETNETMKQTEEQDQKRRKLAAKSSPTPIQFLVHSDAYAQLLDTQAIHANRMKYFSSLLRSFRASKWPNLKILPPRMATRTELERFHSRRYLNFIERIVHKFARTETADAEASRIDTIAPLSEADESLQQEFGLIEGEAIFPELWNLISATVGGTMHAIELLREAHLSSPLAPICSMHWGGGRHHSQENKAEGYCYCNDIAIGILDLLSSSPSFPRILYLDIDLHHGDAVEEAFSSSPSVMTCSFHHFAAGFFPGTGALESNSNSVLNVPLREGIDDTTYCSMFESVLSLVLPVFEPSIVVVCCGVDGLATDRMSPFNLTTRAYAQCIQILKKRLGHFMHQTKATNHDTKETASSSATENEPTPIVGVDAPPASLVPDSASPSPTLVASTSETAPTSMELDNSTIQTVPATIPAPTEPERASSPEPVQLSWNPSSPVPLILLGGGGYHSTDSARAFTCMTAAACGVRLPSKIPDDDQFYPAYLSTNFETHSPAMFKELRPNQNDRLYLTNILQYIRQKLQKWKAEQAEEDSANNMLDLD